MKDTISSGTAHRLPGDIRTLLATTSKVLALWEDITPLARNEWICWIISAKKEETRERRIKIMQSKLLAGDRRPCCWAGCTHR
jgi:uncharacterized protein YdeI (YjbR/CyaY-like superfamily)